MSRRDLANRVRIDLPDCQRHALPHRRTLAGQAICRLSGQGSARPLAVHCQQPSLKALALSLPGVACAVPTTKKVHPCLGRNAPWVISAPDRTANRGRPQGFQSIFGTTRTDESAFETPHHHRSMGKHAHPGRCAPTAPALSPVPRSPCHVSRTAHVEEEVVRDRYSTEHTPSPPTTLEPANQDLPYRPTLGAVLQDSTCQDQSLVLLTSLSRDRA